MPTIAVLGVQWGDEGKGRIVDLLAEQAFICVRGTGGSNAGHTVLNEFGKFALALTPSGVFNKRSVCVLGGGMVINPNILIKEMLGLKDRGIALDGLCVSSRAALVMPWHLWSDGMSEASAGAKKIGTTKQGIGPAYAEKALRTIIRAACLLDADSLVEKVVMSYDLQPLAFKETVALDDLKKQSFKWVDSLARLVMDTDKLIHAEWKAGANILLEGAQGALLDIDYGTYPFCTSSDCTTLGALKGAGLPPQAVNRVIGVFKAYVTRVGAGPFPTLLKDATGEFIQRAGNEYGTRTGRKRDCGWLDIPLIRYAAGFNGLTELTMTKLDVLTGLNKVGIGARYVLDGKISSTATFDHIARLPEVKVEYEFMPGWMEDIRGVRDWTKLPKNAQKYVRRIQELSGLPITAISTSPNRGDIINNKEYYSFSTFPKSICSH